MAKFIKANGKMKDVEPKNGIDFRLDELQDYVGGHIEIIYLRDGRMMVVNEEGKLRALPINRDATFLYGGLDLITGDVLVCDRNQIQ